LHQGAVLFDLYFEFVLFKLVGDEIASPNAG
jgi:hypothetical protein